MERDRATWLAHGLMRGHAALHKLTRGRINDLPGMPVRFLFLATTGRKSGEPRRVPLLTLPDGDCYLVIASNFGNAWYPAWYHNLHANPEVTIERREGVVVPARAEEITDPDEYAELWARFVKKMPNFKRYRARVDREIPIVRLRPTST